MRAYGIFAGGGVKGAAFAGCLKAAEEEGIHFVGYGGTSAGSIVSLLACVGFTPDQLRQIFIQELSYAQLLDGSLDNLRTLRSFAAILERLETNLLRAFGSLRWTHWRLLQRLSTRLGLYSSHTVRGFLDKLIREKLQVAAEVPLTFGHLRARRLPELQILASDLHSRGPLIYKADTHPDVSVIDAVRASISFPLVFEPMMIGGTRYVDGGLSANLPLALFQEERRTSNMPVLAFDLVAAPEPVSGRYGLSTLLKDMVATTLESSARFLRDMVDGVYHVPIQVPLGIDSLDFELDEPTRERLYDRGYRNASSALKKLQHWSRASNSVEEVQAQFLEPVVMDRLLGALVRDVSDLSGLADVRANVMFPMNGETLKIIYQYGMEDDPDLGIELALDGGCAGLAYSTGENTVADLAEAREQNKLQEWHMTRQQQNMVKRDRSAVLSIPLFDSTVRYDENEGRQPRAILNIDTSTPLPKTRWVEDLEDPAAGAILEWTDIIETMLFGK